MKALYKLSVSRRLGWLVACSVMAMLVLVAILMVSERALIMQERQASVRQAVETAHGILVHFHAQSAKGTMPEDEAKQRAMEAIRPLRYSGAEYFWINDMHPRMVMHPIRPDLQGQDLSGNKDPTGKLLFTEFVNTVKKDGAGYVDYMWPKPGSDVPVAKASYVKGFAPWGWVVGSGVYVDTVQATFVSRSVQAGGITVGLAVLLLLIGWMIARSILRQLGGEPELLNSITHHIAQGDLSVDIPPATDENSVMHGILCMRESVVGIVTRVRQARTLRPSRKLAFIGSSMIFPEGFAINPLIPQSCLIWFLEPLAPELAIMYIGLNLSRFFIRASVTLSVVSVHFAITFSYLSSSDISPLLYIFSILSISVSACDSSLSFSSGMIISDTETVTAPIVE